MNEGATAQNATSAQTCCNAPQSRHPRQSSIAEPGPSLLHAPPLIRAITDGRGDKDSALPAAGRRPPRRASRIARIAWSASSRRDVRTPCAPPATEPAAGPPTPAGREPSATSDRLLPSGLRPPPRRLRLLLLGFRPHDAILFAQSLPGTCYPLFGLLDLHGLGGLR